MPQPLEMIVIPAGDPNHKQVMECLRIAKERVQPFLEKATDSDNHSLREIMAWCWLQGFYDRECSPGGQHPDMVEALSTP